MPIVDAPLAGNWTPVDRDLVRIRQEGGRFDRFRRKHASRNRSRIGKIYVEQITKKLRIALEVESRPRTKTVSSFRSPENTAGP